MTSDNRSRAMIGQFLLCHLVVSSVLLVAVAPVGFVFGLSFAEFGLIGAGALLSFLCHASSFRVWCLGPLFNDVHVWLGRFYGGQAMKFLMVCILFSLYFMTFESLVSPQIVFSFLAVFSFSYVLPSFLLGLRPSSNQINLAVSV